VYSFLVLNRLCFGPIPYANLLHRLEALAQFGVLGAERFDLFLLLLDRVDQQESQTRVYLDQYTMSVNGPVVVFNC
jgi:hypothetical protein